MEEGKGSILLQKRLLNTQTTQVEVRQGGTGQAGNAKHTYNAHSQKKQNISGIEKKKMQRRNFCYLSVKE